MVDKSQQSRSNHTVSVNKECLKQKHWIFSLHTLSEFIQCNSRECLASQGLECTDFLGLKMIVLSFKVDYYLLADTI